MAGWEGRGSGRFAPASEAVEGGAVRPGAAYRPLHGAVGQGGRGFVAFPDADPTDGKIEVGVVTAGTRVEWARVLARLATGSVERSPLTRTTKGSKIDVRFTKPTAYELDDGERPNTKKLKVRVQPAAARFAVPAGTTS